MGINAGSVIRLSERGRQIVLEADDVEETNRAIDAACGIFSGSGMLEQLMKERRLERTREARRQTRRLR
jgi:hypothetical protein